MRFCAETPDLLLAAPPGSDVLASDEAILVGQIFSGTNQRLSELPAGIAQCRHAADLSAALDGLWGNYALFFASEGRIRAYREPSGSVGVYRVGRSRQAIYLSDAELASKLGLLEGTAPDLRFAVHWLQYPFLRTRRTGLDSVTELLPGMLEIVDADGRTTSENVWHPQAFVDSADAIMDEVEAAARLKDLALAVVPAQLPPKETALLRLSGGLDSSVIAACLAKAGCSFSCVNFATRSRDGDERGYAQEVARASGLRLEEILEPLQARLEIPARPMFRPPTNPLLLPFESAVHFAARELNASLLVDGGGGDNLFCSTSSAAPALDALRRCRFADAARAVSDIAERANCTFSDVLVAAARRSARQRRTWKEDRSFLAPHALLPSPELHPWLLRLRAPPGKREHVEALVHIQHFLDRGMSSIRLLHPLLCQPLMELCLRIPSWLWVRGGRDRAIARAAFAGTVPQAVLARRAKGSLQSMFHRSFSQLRKEMLELLASGELVAAGIVDPKAVRESMTGSAWRDDAVQLRISEMVALELWLHSVAPASPPSRA